MDNLTSESSKQSLPLSKTLSLGFQHMIIAVLAAIPVPLIISNNAMLTPAQSTFFISAVIFTTGICTILASLDIIPRTSPKVPMVMGASFSIIPVATAILVNGASVKAGFQILAGATIVGGVMCFLLSSIWVKLKLLFPPLVVGTNLMILSVALIPNAIHWVMGDGAYDLTGSVEYKGFLLALGIFLFHIVISKYLKGILGNLTILIALIVGAVAAAAMGMIDFTAVKEASWFGLIMPFSYGLPKFQVTSIISVCIVTILTMVEVSGTSMGIHSIAKKEMTDEQFSKVFKTTGIATVLSGGFNSVQPTAFVQNLGILELSKTPNRLTTATVGLMLILVGLVPKISALISVIPTPVLGGVGFAIFGVILGSSVSLLKIADLDNNNNKLVVGISIGVAMIPSIYPNFYANFPELINNIFSSGILAGSITCILLNIFFNLKDLLQENKKAS